MRKKYEKYIDKDEIGGPNDEYKNLSNKLGDLASMRWMNAKIFPLI